MDKRFPKKQVSASRRPEAALLDAIDRRDAKRVEELLRQGAPPNTTDEHGTPALNCALYGTRHAEEGDESIAMLLLEAGAEPDRPDTDRATPILLACKNGFARMVRSLLQREVNLSAKTTGGVFYPGATPLSIAAGKGYREIVRMLLHAGADVNQPVRKGVNALASATGDIAMVRELIAAGGRATGMALFGPISRGRLDIVTDLLAAGAGSELGIIDRWGNTVLGAAVQSGHAGIVRAIIRAGAKLDAVSGGRTPLILAVCNQNAEVVDLLLRAGARVDGRDIYKCTALMEAVYRPDAAIVARLLAAGANPRLKMENGRTAMDAARDGDHTENIKLLEKSLKNK